MTQPKKVLYFAENALSAIQGGGIVAYAVLRGLPADHLLGFFEYRNITPVPEYADRFVYLGQWRTPALFHAINRATSQRTAALLHRRWTERYIHKDLAFVERQVERRGFEPEAVYFSGLSYRYLRLAVMAAERYDVPMVILHMDDWMEIEREQAGKWGPLWGRRIREQLTRAAARSLASTANSPRLAAKLTSLTGHRHVAANNCCSDLIPHAVKPVRSQPNRIPIITYAGAMNRHLQGETLKVLASAVAELNAEGTRVHLHIYTPWEFAPEANSVGVPHAVFYKGQVGREQLADIYRRSDFLVTTVTYREGHISLFRHSLSTKLSEYLCTGKPVISMGHADWHLHEYVQDHGCGFSILMDENFSRARIKEQLRRILATDRDLLDRIGRNNRSLWERAHDVDVMARDTRRAVGLAIDDAAQSDLPVDRRGVIWVGQASSSANTGWVPLTKTKAVARRLVDIFGHAAVDVIGVNVSGYPELGALVAHCRDIGLIVTVADGISLASGADRWDAAGARWSLAPRQLTPSGPIAEPRNIFEQVAALRGGTVANDSPAQRAVNQLSVRVSEAGTRKPIVWVYGSLAVGTDVIAAIEAHEWLGDAVEIGGFLSSPGHCKADILEGRAWKAVDALAPEAVDFIFVTSETSRLAIQEELLRRDLLDRLLPLFGLAGTSDACSYERIPGAAGQTFRPGATARDYARCELMAWANRENVPATFDRIHQGNAA